MQFSHSKNVPTTGSWQKNMYPHSELYFIGTTHFNYLPKIRNASSLASSSNALEEQLRWVTHCSFFVTHHLSTLRAFLRQFEQLQEKITLIITEEKILNSKILLTSVCRQVNTISYQFTVAALIWTEIICFFNSIDLFYF